METVVLFLDYANINRAARDKGVDLDYKALLEYVSEGRFLVDAHCYVPLDPRNSHRLDAPIQNLWRSGYIVNTKMGTIAGDSYKCNFDVEMTMDILKVAYHVKPNIIVLASGDSDFVPVIIELRRSGIRVEVASFEASAAHDMMLKCSGFISLDHYLTHPSETAEDAPREASPERMPTPSDDERPPGPDVRSQLMMDQDEGTHHETVTAPST